MIFLFRRVILIWHLNKALFISVQKEFHYLGRYLMKETRFNDPPLIKLQRSRCSRGKEQKKKKGKTLCTCRSLCSRSKFRSSAALCTCVPQKIKNRPTDGFTVALIIISPQVLQGRLHVGQHKTRGLQLINTNIFVKTNLLTLKKKTF